MSTFTPKFRENRDGKFRHFYRTTENGHEIKVLNLQDHTPRFKGRSDERCNGCWFGFGHSEAFHNSFLKGDK
ncbi:hypothetical protein [Deinococcus misasensis]|uniref:hypothetical protein n=1 Tax=Deinococcus misasensis TaxID=392413 RepID=UPI00055689BC|nr:hypothetical protein [Deinococcus misasensis]